MVDDINHLGEASFAQEFSHFVPILDMVANGKDKVSIIVVKGGRRLRLNFAE
jgi:hypothetical protein